MARVFLVFGTSVKGGVEHRRADPIRQRRSTGKPAEKSVAVSQHGSRVQAHPGLQAGHESAVGHLRSIAGDDELADALHRQCVSTGV
jgi:hypothetical protein